MKRVKKDPQPLPPLKKGNLIVLKAPPYYTKGYLYEIMSAGDRLVRASLYNSPKVNKSWTVEELAALFEHGIAQLASAEEIVQLKSTAPGKP